MHLLALIMLASMVNTESVVLEAIPDRLIGVWHTQEVSLDEGKTFIQDKFTTTVCADKIVDQEQVSMKIRQVVNGTYDEQPAVYFMFEPDDIMYILVEAQNLMYVVDVRQQIPKEVLRMKGELIRGE